MNGRGLECQDIGMKIAKLIKMKGVRKIKILIEMKNILTVMRMTILNFTMEIMHVTLIPIKAVRKIQILTQMKMIKK